MRIVFEMCDAESVIYYIFSIAGISFYAKKIGFFQACFIISLRLGAESV